MNIPVANEASSIMQILSDEELLQVLEYVLDNRGKFDEDFIELLQLEISRRRLPS
jgi:hypothetical protein